MPSLRPAFDRDWKYKGRPHIQYLFKILIKQVVAKICAGVDYHHCCEGFSPNMPD